MLLVQTQRAWHLAGARAYRGHVWPLDPKDRLRPVGVRPTGPKNQVAAALGIGFTLGPAGEVMAGRSKSSLFPLSLLS